MQLVIISGRSGSGKSIALQALEDLGFYAIDNLPAMLLGSLIEELETQIPARHKVAVSIDARNIAHALERLPEFIELLKPRDIDIQVVYITADSAQLLERYSATRRRHPLTRDSEMTLDEAIETEQHYLSPVRDLADLVIDTSHTSVHELRARIAEQVACHTSTHLTLSFESFGFKHGVPRDADMVFDARCLPNPYWEPALRDSTGRDVNVQQFLAASSEVSEMFNDICQWLERWLPRYLSTHRSYFTVAVGCTGGQHRSVYLVEQLAHRFAREYPSVRLRHRQLELQQQIDRRHTSGPHLAP
ncbi:RNase adapter RapZ [Carnimonas nigrificans]|uniref:RNase adapter RapZ n=1 Tax=Carnimonas nigrificans TaxID=64323 RepID=UPI000471D839|nr:RNase adapter RapZ [Carnimonas nigrificans]